MNIGIMCFLKKKKKKKNNNNNNNNNKGFVNQCPHVSHTRLSMSSCSSSTAGRVHWQRSAPGRLKCNIDASFLQSMNLICIGICVCNDDGAFVLTKTINFSPLCFVPDGEVLCLFNTIEWLSDMQMDNVDFVVDSKTINDVFNFN
jgi:hypothetical protein